MQDIDFAEQPASAGRARGGWRTAFYAALFAFALGIALAAWFVAEDGFGLFDFGRRSDGPAAPAGIYTPPPAGAAAPVATAAAPLASPALGGVETRLALLEERLSRLDLQADAARGNAARAEGLLVAFAARRLVDKGAPLGPLEDQLKLRFGGAQPQAVSTLADFARSPVTLDQLLAELDAIAPELDSASANRSGWDRVRAEFASLFVISKSTDPASPQRARAERARVMLTAGRPDAAIAEIEKLPGAASAAAAWIDRVRRYAAAQQALDLVETAAMLEPRLLNDASGEAVSEPGPLAPGIPAASPAQP